MLTLLWRERESVGVCVCVFVHVRVENETHDLLPENDQDFIQGWGKTGWKNILDNKVAICLYPTELSSLNKLFIS